MRFWLGCAIWAYKDWVGDLFPAGSRSAEFLSLYSRRFTTVEGNTTFYSVPDADTVQRWARETPSGFHFCLKLPRAITHQGLLAPKLPELRAFLERMQPLSNRLGPLFAQLPPSYGPEQWQDLLMFLKALPFEQASFAVEVRHPAWFQEPATSRLNAALTELGVGRVLLDSRPIYDCPDDPQLHCERRKPNLPLQRTITAPFSLVRYISHPNLEQNQRFLQEWSLQIEQWLTQNKRIYFFVHCPIEARSPRNAYALQQLLEQRAVPVPPLPWDVSPISDSIQLSLF
ncbi:MAG: DUF72 domain-containing protein [Synechococcales cyanobacterium C42_A2020_086]|jgi:uncharacterized protein YecE (DUF72 family)|nr:DUF72 domain-containing protein [Synechococcales cyanobacterium C42_A2020_086]